MRMPRRTLLWILLAVLVGLIGALAIARLPALAALREWLLSFGVAQAALLGAVVAVVVLGLAFHWLQEIRREAAERRAAEHRLRPQAEAVEAAKDGIAVSGRADSIVYANPAWARLFGYGGSRDLFGRGWRDLFAAGEAERVEREVLPALRGAGRWVGELRARRRDGEAVDLDVSLSAMESGGLVWVVRETARRRTAEAERQQADARYRALFHAAGSAILLLSPDGRLVEWNEEAARLHGGDREDVRGREFAELFAPPEHREKVESALRRVREEGEPEAFEAPASPSGGDRLVLWNVTGLDGLRVEGLVAVGQDVTERKRTEEALSEREGLYRLLAHNSSDLVALHAPDGRFDYVSPSAEPLLGYAQQELVGKDLYQISHSDDWKQIQTALVAAAAGRPSRIVYRLRNSTGEYCWFETLLRPIQAEDGSLEQLQSSSRDVTERKEFEQQLRYQALHEPLTGLPNRTLFMDRLNQALARARRMGNSVAIMFLDLDRFKVINDSLGHAAGDRLLAAVARRIAGVVREADTVARLGGDEFGVLLEFNIAQSDVGRVADRIVGQLEPPFTFAGRDVFVSGSIGIAFSTPETETGEDLLRFADVAMYRAKHAGPGSWRVFDPEVDTGATRRLEMETALRRALERKELFLVFQPIVSLETGTVTGVEALLRWEHPEWGLVGPDEFIPLAEETGLIVPIGNWVVRRAWREVREWEAEHRPEGPPLTVSVNLSVLQLDTDELQEIVREMLSGPSGRALQLEVTETELVQSVGRIRPLKELGVRIAIDDFGTGYSSLSYLKNLPVDELKIDRSFVRSLEASREDAAIVHTVVTLAESLGLGVTAEGVEKAEHVEHLRRLGCDRGQGYHFARPVRMEELGELLLTEPTW